MFRHYYVTDQSEVMPVPNFVQIFHEYVAVLGRLQQRSSVITTEGDEMEVTLSVIAIQGVTHESKIRTLKTEGCGTPL